MNTPTITLLAQEATYRVARFVRLSSFLRQPSDAIERQFEAWRGTQVYGFDEAMDLCLQRAMAGHPMPWEEQAE